MLEKTVETKREELVKLAFLYGFTNSKTVQCSQELDNLLNKLQYTRGGNVKRYA